MAAFSSRKNIDAGIAEAAKEAKEFDPTFENEEMDFIDHVKSVRKFERKEESALMHGDEGGMIYKYDLPVVNSAIKFHN